MIFCTNRIVYIFFEKYVMKFFIKVPIDKFSLVNICQKWNLAFYRSEQKSDSI